MQDLWEYNLATNIWTWINGPSSGNGSAVYGTQGVPAPANIPGARVFGSSSWTDQQGHLWMHGGTGYNAAAQYGVLGDMWMYDIPTNEWTWMKGPDTVNAVPVYGMLQTAADTNSPGGRVECNSSWVQSDGTLWTFGGLGNTISPGTRGAYNDMWKFDVSINEWTWMAGARGAGSPGNYGTLGIESVSNLPPNRGSYTRWIDHNGNFYLFSGVGSGLRNENQYNDVWKFDHNNNLWTWISGNNTDNGGGQYTGYCAPGSDALPSSRIENRTVETFGCTDVFWTFGGLDNVEIGAYGDIGTHNDLWTFNVITDMWTWVSGSDHVNSTGSYGTMGIGNVNNMIPSRGGDCMWVDASGILWIWGGMNFKGKEYSDMWKFVPDPTCISAPDTNDISQAICKGDTVTFYGDIITGAGTYLHFASDCDSILRLTVVIDTTQRCSPADSFIMPDAFTPNGDGKNDLFYPVLNGQNDSSVISFSIYNRWGQLVYNNPSQGWDGRYKGEPQPEGIYTYFVTVDLPDPNNPGRMKETKREGGFALVR
jgi:gliding motility-associated-like protein